MEEVAIPLISPIRPGPPDLIPGLMPRSGSMVIAAPTNQGKTLLALEMVSSLVTGNPLWGELQPHTIAKKILYILAEHADETVQRLWQHTKLPMSENVFLLGPEALGPDKWVVGGGNPNMVGISKIQKWAEGVDLVVWDPLSGFIMGSGEVENDNVTMRLLMDSINSVSASSGAACLILAHQGKPQMDQFGKEHARRSYAVRGASAIEDSSTHIFYLERASNDAIESETGGKVFELICRKFKGSTAPAKFTLLRDKDTLTHQLISDKPFETVRKIDLRAKAQRLRDMNPAYNEKTILENLAAIEGKPLVTIQRWMGLLAD